MNRLAAALALVLLFPAVSTAQFDIIEVIVDEDFEAYTSDFEMQQVWVPTGTGAESRLVDSFFWPDAFPNGGQGVEHLGGFVNNLLFDSIHPTANEWVRVEVDIYNDASNANKRVSLGLRSGANNILELGAWNANTCDPTVEGCVPGTSGEEDPGFIPAAGRGLAHRVILFGPPHGDLLVQPNWQYFDLPSELDTNEDDVVALFEIGPGWHRYMATIGPDFVTVELDLFRDGVRNDTRDEDGNIIIGEGTPGVDASVTWTIDVAAAGFDDIRFGGPSNVASAGGSLLFDNIFLALIEAADPPVGLPGDFNQDGVVDAADYTVWRDNIGAAGLPNDEELGTVGQAHYDLWRANFGNAIPPTHDGAALGAAAVPEPSALVLVFAGLVALALVRRGR